MTGPGDGESALTNCRASRRGLLLILASGIIAVSACLVFQVDLSPAPGFVDDAAVRDWSPTHPRTGFNDPSPVYVWLPSDLFVWDSIRSGHLPLWERLQGGGYSPLLTIYNGVLHPARWVTAMFPRRAAPTVLIVVALTIAAAGAWLLSRELGHRPLAAGIASFAFALGSPLLSVAPFSGSLLSVAQIPLLLWLYRRAWRGGQRWAVLLLAAGVASEIASGHPLIVCSSLAAVVLVAGASAVLTRSFRPLALVSVALLIGTAIAAPVWMPVLAAHSELWTYKTGTARGLSYNQLSMYGWSDAIIGSIVDECGRDCAPDSAQYYDYVGPVAAALILLGIWITIRRRADLEIVVAGAVAFLFAVPGPWMAPFTTIKPIAFAKPWYLLGPVGLFAAVLAAAGADALLRHPDRRMRFLVWIGLLIMVPAYVLRADLALRPQKNRPLAVGPVVARWRAPRAGVRVTGLWGQTHEANSSRITGIEDVRLSGPILPLRYHLWWNLVDPDVMSRAYPTTRITDHLTSPLVGDFNVGFVFEGRFAPSGTFATDPNPRFRDQRLSRALRDAGFPVVFRSPSLEVRRLTTFEPRARFASKVVTVTDLRAAVSLLSANPELARDTAVVEAARDEVPSGAAEGTVEVRYPRDAEVLLGTSSRTGGLVVLHDSYASGWRATVDGRAAKIFPVNVLSRGTVVPPGRHVIRMTYTPAGLIPALWVSAAVGCVAAAWALSGGKRRTHSRPLASVESASF